MDRSIDCFEVRRDDLGTTRLASEPIPPLGEGQALLRVARFGLSANNITYGVAGDTIGYWNFFPSTDGWGRLPVWGFAEVVDGEVPGLPLGTQLFGYFPMSTHLVVEPVRVAATGFTDGSAHRAALPAVYNHYRRTDADPLHSAGTANVEAIFVPLFVTSFVLDDFLADNADFGAERIVLTSASSKTAAGTALCIANRAGGRPRVTGLTSGGHVEFVEGLGCYDEVVTYDEVESLDPTSATVLVDVAGNAGVQHAVHRHLGDSLVASYTVGMTHWDAAPQPDALPGPAPTMFFAPTQIQKRVAEWGSDGYQERLGVAWGWLLGVAEEWVDIEEIDGLDEVTAPYLRMLAGDVSPHEGFIIDVGG